ncbi:MAG: thiamine phosphate synthase [Flavobacteriales bacterium]|nr:thiamine phosphate synthase [Flavobacteriales bacterium]
MNAIQYITDDNASVSHAQQAEQACAGGIRWIQFRCKSTDEDYRLQQGHAVAAVCKKYQATFIVNDDPRLAMELDADGVHLGKADMSPKDARILIGDTMIIGATANRSEDLDASVMACINYIGVGPFRHTNTKKNLSPLLGLDGIRNVIRKWKELNFSTPVFAIGGILIDDIPALMETGITGVAVSSAIHAAENPGLMATAFKHSIEENRRYLKEAGFQPYQKQL